VLEGLAIQVDPKARIISKAYPYIASRVLTDPQDDLQEALRRLALTNEGHVRWDRLEDLLEEAKESQGYDVTAALDVLTNYLITEDGDRLLSELSEQIVASADNFGAESGRYLLEASRALAINDEVAAGTCELPAPVILLASILHLFRCPGTIDSTRISFAQ